MNAEDEEIDGEWEEEEQLVVVHLSGIIDMDYLKKCDATNCKVLGIDTDAPAIQIDRMCFHGNYNESVGTNIIFEEQSDEMENGEIKKKFKQMCHTTKNLDMIRVFLNNTKSTETGENSVDTTILHNTVEKQTEEQREDITDPQESTSTQMLVE